MLKNLDISRDTITTPEASKLSGLSTVHITRLLRSGALEGVQLGREWLVYVDSLNTYVAAPHKPGPKGPIKKGKKEEESLEEK